MKRIILASHGSLAEGMLSAVKMILGSDNDIEAYGLDTYGEPTHIFDVIEKKIQERQDNQFIVFTDINGGSVQNQLMQLCNYPNVYVQTGMCLSMILEVVLADDEISTFELMDKVVSLAKENMLGFSKATIQDPEEEELW